MKGIKKIYRKNLSILVISLLLPVISACGGVTPAGPTINSFTSTSASITEGQSVTLSWVTNAATISIDQGIGSVTAPSGSATVTPTSIGTLNFTLTATNSAGSNTDTVKITVLPVGIIVIPQYLTIQPGLTEGKDSYIYSNYPDDNYGNINSVALLRRNLHD